MQPLKKKFLPRTISLEQDTEWDENLNPTKINEKIQNSGHKGLFIASLHEFSNATILDMTRTNDASFKMLVYRGYEEKFGSRAAASTGHRYVIERLALATKEIESQFRRHGWNSDENTREGKKAKIILTIIKPLLDKVETEYLDRQNRGILEFHDLMREFAPGEPLYYNSNGKLLAGRFNWMKPGYSMFKGEFMNINISVIHSFNGVGLENGSITIEVPAWADEKAIDDLPIKRLTPEVKTELTARGELYRKYTTQTAAYVTCKGQLKRKASWWSEQVYRAEGRAIIDVSTFKRIENDQYNQLIRTTGVSYNEKDSVSFDEDDDISYPEKTEMSLRSRQMDPNEFIPGSVDKELWRCWYRVYGFSFKAKQWGQMDIDDIADIEWKDEAFNQLVLPPKQKQMVRALVENSGDSFQDIVEGKGGGCIFLLHGKPGQGKTLTAEAIAEILHRPLYSISVGELGITPDELEERLRQILDVATIWNAVILLDEADIYLEERNENDVVRNAMVGVFLRLLEYHQGVLFLTTNRVKNIDKAFYSRISIALKFDDTDDDKRRKIWENLLGAANLIDKIKVDDDLAKHAINGRQIKNVIRISQTLAKAKNTDLDIDILKDVINMTTQFEKEFTN